MASTVATRWQFSLRAMLGLTAAAAAVGCAYRVFGAAGLIGAGFVALSAAPVAVLSGRGRWAYLMAYFSVYGPFIAMATYTYFFVECDHCKATTWKLLPIGPAIVPADLALWALDAPRQMDGRLGATLCICLSAAAIAALTWVFATRRRWIRALSAIAAVSGCSFGAYVLLALIRA